MSPEGQKTGRCFDESPVAGRLGSSIARAIVHVGKDTAIMVCAAIALTILAGCSTTNDGPGELLVFAAASLADALGEVEAEFEATGQRRVAVSYGGSQMLAQQIATGAPADVLISAGELPVRFLADRGLIGPVRVSLLTNRLVVAVRSDHVPRVTSIADLKGPVLRRIAIADPKMAPAGAYARESLVSQGLWEEVRPKLIFGADVRATLAYVESGNADAAIVYATDAMAATNLRSLDIIPPDSYTAIRYPAVVNSRSRHLREARQFLDFLGSEGAREVFRRHGFEPLD